MYRIIQELMRDGGDGEVGSGIYLSIVIIIIISPSATYLSATFTLSISCVKTCACHPTEFMLNVSILACTCVGVGGPHGSWHDLSFAP